MTLTISPTQRTDTGTSDSSFESLYDEMVVEDKTYNMLLCEKLTVKVLKIDDKYDSDGTMWVLDSSDYAKWATKSSSLKLSVEFSHPEW